MMIVPPEFNNFARCFHLYIAERHATSEAMIEVALRQIGPSQAAVLGRFIDTLLRSKPSVDELNELWWRSPADLKFADKAQLPMSFQLLRDAIRREDVR